MIIYFIIGILSGTLLFLAEKSEKKITKNLFIVLSFVPFFGVLAFRYGIGYDYLHIYTKIFMSVLQGNPANWEAGIIVICKLISYFSSDPFYFFFITSLITSIFVYKGILKNSAKPWLSLVLFIIAGLYMDAMNAVRQYIAVSIFAYSFYFIEKKDFKRYLVLIICASLFHTSALMLIPVYYFCNLNLTPRRKLLCFILILALMPFINTIFINVISHTKYAFYISSVYGEANPTYSELMISSILFLASTIIYKRAKDKEHYNVYYNLTFLFFIIAILSFKILLAYRVIMYFKVVLIYMIPLILRNIYKMKNRFAAYVITFGLLSGITLIGAYKFNWYDTKYISIFNK